MGWEGGVKHLYSQKSRAAEKGKEAGDSLFLSPHVPPPHPLNHTGARQILRGKKKKKLVCKHTSTSGKLPSSTPSLRSLFWAGSWLSGRALGRGYWGLRVGCGGQGPARPQVFGSYYSGGDSTFRTPPDSSGKVGESLNSWARTPRSDTLLPHPPRFAPGRSRSAPAWPGRS